MRIKPRLQYREFCKVWTSFLYASGQIYRDAHRNTLHLCGGKGNDNHDITDFTTSNQNYARFSCSYANTVMAQYNTVQHHSHHINDICLFTWLPGGQAVLTVGNKTAIDTDVLVWEYYVQYDD